MTKRFASAKERSTWIKEAAGVLTDNDRLKRRGKLDQVVGKVKETADKAVDKMEDALTSKGPRARAR